MFLWYIGTSFMSILDSITSLCTQQSYYGVIRWCTFPLPQTVLEAYVTSPFFAAQAAASVNQNLAKVASTYCHANHSTCCGILTAFIRFHPRMVALSRTRLSNLLMQWQSSAGKRRNSGLVCLLFLRVHIPRLWDSKRPGFIVIF